jgi:hypothetical protein
MSIGATQEPFKTAAKWPNPSFLVTAQHLKYLVNALMPTAF